MGHKEVLGLLLKESQPKKVIKQEDSSDYGINLQEREDVIAVNKGNGEKPTTNKNVGLRR